MEKFFIMSYTLELFLWVSHQVHVFLNVIIICFDYFQKIKTNNVIGQKTPEPVVMFKNQKTWHRNSYLEYSLDNINFDSEESTS